MKFNWGHKIILTFAAFFVLMGTLIFKSINTDFQLVAPNYYEKEIAYQQRIDAINRASNIGLEIIVTPGNYLKISSDEAISNGVLYFYCPFDNSADCQVGLNLKDKEQVLNIQNIKKGKWEVEVVFLKNDLLHVVKKIIIL